MTREDAIDLVQDWRLRAMALERQHRKGEHGKHRHRYDDCPRALIWYEAADDLAALFHLSRALEIRP